MDTTHPSDRPSTTAADDWRLRLPERRRRHLRAWFLSIAAMTLAVLVIGGVTRLTRSGLSIVDWDPVMGILPPLSEAGWLEAFERYRQFPEYQLTRRGMTLADFKFIYFWEYLHRLAARAIGLVFLVPFVVFWLRGYFDRPLALRSLALFGLGAAQGVMGWLMVASGLVDRPSVSHLRLAAHLSLAFLIFGYAIWLALELRVERRRPVVPLHVRPLLRRGVAVLGLLLGAQVVWGAFVAGLKAGFFHNTFPLMGGRLVPAELLAPESGLGALVHDPAVVQWMHRLLGTLLLVAAAGAFVAVRRATEDRASRWISLVFLALVAGQYLLGVFTLLYHVPLSLGVTHQAAAMVLFGVWVAWAHHVRTLELPGARVTTSEASGRLETVAASS